MGSEDHNLTSESQETSDADGEKCWTKLSKGKSMAMKAKASLDAANVAVQGQGTCRDRQPRMGAVAGTGKYLKGREKDEGWEIDGRCCTM
jgi:hypothetical protein